jgi:putative ABC transport system permease protein
MPARRTVQILYISMRNVWRFHLQTALIAIAALTGTGGVIVSTGYAAGGREKILSQFAHLGADLLIVTPLQSRAVGGRARTGSIVTTLSEADYRAILESVNGINGSSPAISAVLRIRAGDLTKSTTVVGCEPDYFRMKSWRLASGEPFELSASRRQARVVLLGATVDRDLFGDEDPTGQQIIINRVPFLVAGVLAERGQGLDAADEDDQVYVPLQTAMHRLTNVNYFNSILFEIDSGMRMDAAEQKIGTILEQRHRILAASGRDFQIQNQKRLIETQLAAFGRLTFLIQWIAASALTVSSLGVFGITWIGVRNRTREIGTRRAIGAAGSDVLIQFMAEGLGVALCGAGAGAAFAFFVLRFIDAGAGQPFRFSAIAVASDLLTSTALYAAFTFISSFRTIRVNPSVALRAE